MYKWHLPVDGKDVNVCEFFFLATLGFTPENDKPVLTAIGSGLTDPPDKRGKATPANKLDREIIVRRIMPYKPVTPHYQYLHAPNRRYLPAELNKPIMFRHFQEDHGNFSVQRAHTVECWMT